MDVTDVDKSVVRHQFAFCHRSNEWKVVRGTTPPNRYHIDVIDTGDWLGSGSWQKEDLQCEAGDLGVRHRVGFQLTHSQLRCIL
jgi:hypothetical protein